jgi:hypothetical protein
VTARPEPNVDVLAEPIAHASDDFYENDEGWWEPRCCCGWYFGAVVPSAEDACDALMDHVYEAALARANTAQAELLQDAMDELRRYSGDTNRALLARFAALNIKAEA